MVYMALFSVSYVYFISPTFYYTGFVNEPHSPSIFLFTLGAALLPATWMPLRMERPSQIIYLFMYVAVCVPSILILALASVLPPGQTLKFTALILVAVLLTRLAYHMPLLRFRPLLRSKLASTIGILSMGAVLYAFIFARYGISLDIPSLSEVYSQRAEFREQVSGLGAYAFFWLAKAINPFLIAKGYLERDVKMLSLGVAGQLLLFSLSGLKSILFSLLLIGGVLITIQKRGRYFGNLIVWGIAALVLVTVSVDYYLGISVMSSLFVRRLLMVPGLNTGYFFDFFSQNPNAHLGHSFFSSIADYPYEASPAFVVGDAYYGHLGRTLETSANVNLWADGYANFGVLGIFIFTVAFVLVLWIMDSLAERKNKSLATLILAYPAYVLVNTKLHTSLLTHGIIVVLLILYLLPIHDEEG